MADRYAGEPDSGRRRLHLRGLLLLIPRKEAPQQRGAGDENGSLMPPLQEKKKGFAFRGFGCRTSSVQVHAPAATESAAAAAVAVRSSADWQGKKSGSGRRKKSGKVKKKDRERSPVVRKNQTLVAAASASDVWCAPGIGFDGSVDCVAPSFQQNQGPSRGRAVVAESERIEREQGPCSGRRGAVLSSVLGFPQSPFELPLFGSELIPPRHLHRARRIRRSSGGLDEMVMFQARFMLGETDMHDRYRDWRLDVDNMSYEQLLELGERIGHVNTGLREDEIFRCLRKVKHSIFNASPKHFSIERKCSICQEDYEVNDEMGKLECGHTYHTSCIKQWLLRKNACPVCKATVAKS